MRRWYSKLQPASSRNAWSFNSLVFVKAFLSFAWCCRMCFKRACPPAKRLPCKRQSSMVRMELVHSLHCHRSLPCMQPLHSQQLWRALPREHNGILQLLPPHSRHRALRLPWLHREAPPHSLQYHARLPWGQREEPAHSEHTFFSRPWQHKEMPPQSLHRDFCLPWAQKGDPPHSLHFFFCLPWGRFFPVPMICCWWLPRLKQFYTQSASHMFIKVASCCVSR